MRIEIDGKAYVYPLDEISASLAKASDAERMIYEISPSGYGIHWPLPDEDISIGGRCRELFTCLKRKDWLHNLNVYTDREESQTESLGMLTLANV